MRSRIGVGLVATSLFLTVFASGCAANTSSSNDDSSADDALSKRNALAPIALQYAAKYGSVPTKMGDITALTIKRNGTYSARFARDDTPGEAPEIGSIKVTAGSASAPAYPIVFHFTATDGTSDVFDGTISDPGTSTLHIAIEGDSFDLVATSDVGPNESICDASGGSWTDDDADPATGLYCVCSKGKSYIPSLGGCTK